MKPELNHHAGRPAPLIASVTMGYGHLRAAHPLAQALGQQVVAVDQAPIAAPSEMTLWHWLRRMHELLSKPLPVLTALDGPSRELMNTFTRIPSLHEPREHHKPTWPVRLLDKLVHRGLGRGLVAQLLENDQPLLTTFYAPAIIADFAGVKDIYCVVTDADCNRVWAPMNPSKTRIQYLAPTPRVVRRLQSFGVPEHNIQLTGFPLPHSLTDTSCTDSVGARFAQRLQRLDPTGRFRELFTDELRAVLPTANAPPTEQPLTLLFAVGGAGAQAELPAQFLPSLRPRIVRGDLRLLLAAGTRADVKATFVRTLRDNQLEAALGTSVRIIEGQDFEQYYSELNLALRTTDILWTKPSEMSFYPALGIPCIIAPAVGAHERYNGAWLREQGVGLKQRNPKVAQGWLTEWLEDGTLAGAAWSGFTRLPKHGTHWIVEALSNPQWVKKPRTCARQRTPLSHP